MPDPTVRYRAFEVSRFPLGGQRELVYSHLTRRADPVSALGVRLLLGCRTFATLEEHAARLCQELNLGHAQPAVRGELAALVEVGLLVSVQHLVEQATVGAGTAKPQAAEKVDEAPSITTLGIPTRNRPDCLSRCLHSHIQNARQYGRTPQYVVADDSDDEEMRNANRRILESLRDQYGVAVACIGPSERERFVEHLCGVAGLPSEPVRFALLNSGEHAVATGINRNALLLQSVGEVLLQVDDDTICSLSPAPGVESGVRLTARADPTDFWFFGEGESVLPPSGFVLEDFLGLHERLLGRDVGALASGHESMDLETAGASILRRLHTGRVASTTAGVRGDSGMASPVYFLALDGPARERLLRSERDYRFALNQHLVMRSATRTTLCEPGVCLALNLGLDNRRLLPPFMPVGRNQDGIFAAILRIVDPDALHAFLPWMVLHQPPESRQPLSTELARRAVRVGSGQIIQALIGSAFSGSGCVDVAFNLRLLGISLQRLALQRREDFRELVRLQLWGQMSGLASRLDAQLRKYAGQPGFWANDLRAVLTTLGETLADADYPVPWDLCAPGQEDLLARLQRLIRRFGQLLETWPDMVEAARDLRDRGVRLGDAI